MSASGFTFDGSCAPTIGQGASWPQAPVLTFGSLAANQQKCPVGWTPTASACVPPKDAPMGGNVALICTSASSANPLPADNHMNDLPTSPGWEAADSLPWYSSMTQAEIAEFASAWGLPGIMPSKWCRTPPSSNPMYTIVTSSGLGCYATNVCDDYPVCNDPENESLVAVCDGQSCSSMPGVPQFSGGRFCGWAGGDDPKAYIDGFDNCNKGKKMGLCCPNAHIPKNIGGPAPPPGAWGPNLDVIGCPYACSPKDGVNTVNPGDASWCRPGCRWSECTDDPRQCGKGAYLGLPTNVGWSAQGDGSACPAGQFRVLCSSSPDGLVVDGLGTTSAYPGTPCPPGCGSGTTTTGNMCVGGDRACAWAGSATMGLCNLCPDGKSAIALSYAQENCGRLTAGLGGEALCATSVTGAPAACTSTISDASECPAVCGKSGTLGDDGFCTSEGGCFWSGTSMFCGGESSDCTDIGMYQWGVSDHGDGDKCWTGHKVLCGPYPENGKQCGTS